MTGMTNAISKHLHVKSYTFPNTDLDSGYYIELEYNVSSSDGTPIGIVGYRIANYTTPGYCSYCTAYNASIDGAKACIYIRNHNSSHKAKIAVTVYILCEN